MSLRGLIWSCALLGGMVWGPLDVQAQWYGGPANGGIGYYGPGAAYSAWSPGAYGRSFYAGTSYYFNSPLDQSAPYYASYPYAPTYPYNYPYGGDLALYGYRPGYVAGYGGAGYGGAGYGGYSPYAAAYGPNRYYGAAIDYPPAAQGGTACPCQSGYPAGVTGDAIPDAGVPVEGYTPTPGSSTGPLTPPSLPPTPSTSSPAPSSGSPPAGSPTPLDTFRPQTPVEKRGDTKPPAPDASLVPLIPRR